ncbi:MAG: cyclic nucleotide-binding domain-containing protein [Desulfobacteraceae bacterium]
MDETQALVDQYIDENRTDDAFKLLCRTAIGLAMHQRFDEAETCLDRLYEINGTALSAIFEVNNIIESEKSRSVAPALRQIWAPIFNRLTIEEANALHLALKPVLLGPDHTIIEQGRANDRLFLINSGRLKMFCRIGGNDILIKNTGKGTFFGQETFFSINVCTHSVRTLSRVELSCLEKKRLVSLQTQFPQLYSNLEKIICDLSRTTYDSLFVKGIERRNCERHRLSTRIRAHLLTSDADQITGKPINGDMRDISKNGLSFYCESKNEKSVQRLLGRAICVRFHLKGSGHTKPIVVKGIVRGVQNHPQDKYSVHLKLTPGFSDTAINTISKIAL